MLPCFACCSGTRSASSSVSVTASATVTPYYTNSPTHSVTQSAFPSALQGQCCCMQLGQYCDTQVYAPPLLGSSGVVYGDTSDGVNLFPTYYESDNNMEWLVTAPDDFYIMDVPPLTKNVTLTTCSPITLHDTVLHIYSSCLRGDIIWHNQSATGFFYNDDMNGCPNNRYASMVTVRFEDSRILASGGRLYIVVDGYAGLSGPYSLTWNVSSFEPDEVMATPLPSPDWLDATPSAVPLPAHCPDPVGSAPPS